MESDPYERGRMHPAHYTSARMAMALMIYVETKQQDAAADLTKLAELGFEEGNELKRLCYPRFDRDDLQLLEQVQWSTDMESVLQFLMNDTFQVPLWVPIAIRLGIHQQSWGIGKVIIEQDPVFDLNESIQSGEFFEMINFRKAGFFRIVDLHRAHLPAVFKSPHRHTCSLEMGLFIVVRRWVGGPMKFMEKELHIRRNVLSDLFHTVMQVYARSVYRILALNVDLKRVKDDVILDAIIEGVQNAHGSDYALGIVVLVDGKPERACRPSISTAKKRGYTFDDDIQRLFYNRYYKGHGLKIAHHIWGDGLVQVVVGSINTPDQVLLEQSALDEFLDDINDWRESRGKQRCMVYGDPAYKRGRNVRAKVKGAMTVAEVVENGRMIRPRSSSEDTFKNFVDLKTI